MTIRTIDLSGRYEIAAVAANRITFVEPEAVNPNWLHGDLDGSGTTGYAQNVTLILTNSDVAVDLGGTYEIESVTAEQITLKDAAGVNADWNTLSSYANGQTSSLSSFVSAAKESTWIGPFIVEGPETAFLVVNVVALQGAYRDDGEDQDERDVEFEVSARPLDADGDALGPWQTFRGEVDGSGKTKDMRAQTLICELNISGRQEVRVRRLTNNDYNFEGSVVDEIKLQDVYGVSAVPQPDFGNVTTIRSRTYATEGALAVKERRLNLLATRKVPLWTAGEQFAPPEPTNHAGHILVEICRDRLLGNRSLAELDLPGIFAALTEATNYFGTSEAVEFSYTFDNDNTSFEEMVTAVATAAFCTAYRQGSLVKLSFEGADDDSLMLFNHRNKAPGTETRSVRFGPADDNDGVELEYVSPDNDGPATIYLPADKSARKPRKITATGVRSHRQAYWAAWRAYNKLRFQHTTTEFTALQEAAPIVRNERILVADNTRADTQDGEVDAQSGLQLTLSQEVDLYSSDAGYTIFLQLPDASVEAIPITAGPTPDTVVLSRAPRLALSLDENLYARTTYQIVANDSPRSGAFLLVEKQAEENGGFAITAVNYSGLYYDHDTLRVWLSFEEPNYFDWSAWGQDGTAAGGSTTILDGVRGKRVHNGAAGRSVTFAAFTPPANYTKAVWLKRSNLTSSGDILSSADEHFGVSGANLVAGHNGTTLVSAPVPDTNWHHAVVVYDSGPNTLELYLDGELVDDAAAVAVRDRVQLVAFNGLQARADDLRLYRRALSAADVRDLYRATRVSG